MKSRIRNPKKIILDPQRDNTDGKERLYIVYRDVQVRRAGETVRRDDIGNIAWASLGLVKKVFSI